MNEKTELEKFPTKAPYSRDKLQFAHNYIDAIVEWKKKRAKKLEKQIQDARKKLEGKMVGDMETQYWQGYIKAKEEDLEALK